MKAIITGGGTGGHIYPALSLANELIKRNWQIKYIGSVDGLEKRVIPAEGIDFIPIKVAPLPRKITPALITFLVKNSQGFFQSLKNIFNFNPDIVIGTGGFVAGPVVLSATMLNTTTLIHEQNVYPGVTNRILARLVDKIAINFADASKHFPSKCQEKLTVTGIPVREKIIKTTREEALEKLNLNSNKKTLLVFGGSQGAAQINNTMIGIYRKLSPDYNWQIIHITGEKNYEQFCQKLNKLNIKFNKNDNNIHIYSYLDNIEWAYAASDLVVGRAGATGLAEITACGLPSILIPYPHASGNHQLYNARTIEKNGAGLVIKEEQLDSSLLFNKISLILNNYDKLKEMSENSYNLGQPESIDKLICTIDNLF